MTGDIEFRVMARINAIEFELRKVQAAQVRSNQKYVDSLEALKEITANAAQAAEKARDATERCSAAAKHASQTVRSAACEDVQAAARLSAEAAAEAAIAATVAAAAATAASAAVEKSVADQTGKASHSAELEAAEAVTRMADATVDAVRFAAIVARLLRKE